MQNNSGIFAPSVLITGANGFIGKSLCAELVRQGFSVRAAVHLDNIANEQVETVPVGIIDGNTEWSGVLSGIKVIIHLAARVHVMQNNTMDSLDAFRSVNVEGAWNLARQAAEAGVQRFIFISSIKVNGESTPMGQPFTADDSPAPADAYGISKLEAEEALLKLADETGMQVVVIRPPLVYGPGVKANFNTMMRWLARGIPSPLGSIRNKRSLVALDNLVDLIITCMDHPAAANQIFLAGDGEDLSTPELLQRMGIALGKPARLFPMPVWLLKFFALLTGQRSVTQRLCHSLQVDIEKTCELLGWHPPVTVDEALKKTAEDFLQKSRTT